MKNKGFTLVELIAVVAILAVASVLVATRFFGLIGDSQKFEDETVAKGIAEAAFIFFDSKDNTISKTLGDCYPATDELLTKGYISENQGLLTDCTFDECLSKFYYKVTKTDGKKVAEVYKTEGECTGTACCTGEALYTY